jgi:sugar lactone lactonase YvrE
MYRPSLESMPDAWTIAVKVNDSGDEKMPFGGPGNVAFDDNGYAWITNNVVQGHPTSANNIIVLQPNGKPADGTNGTPKSPITGGGILGTGFGVTVAPNGHVWLGNFGWGGDNPTPEPPGTGSVSELEADGKVRSVPDGYYSGTDRVQSVAADQEGNIWSASFGNNRVVVFPNGEHARSFWFPVSGDGPKATFGIAIAEDGSAWVTNSGDLTVHGKSGIGRYAIEGSQVVQKFFRELGHSLKGLSLDSQGNVWVASGGDNAVYLLSPEGELLGKFNGGGVSGPWSVTVDGDDHVWVANFGPTGHGADYRSASISKLAGTNPGTLPPRHKTGDPISPSTGYTLPSAGSPVLLANGDPLYGKGSPPSFTPLTRMTNCCIDQAGNVWAVNNWKPNFDIAANPKTGNPGGDGIVIFVGLAKPPRKKHEPHPHVLVGDAAT